MGYQVTITRADADSDDGLITKDEWLAYASRDPELTVEDAEEPNPVVNFTTNGEQAQLFWEDGGIWSSSPEEDVITKMVFIAKTLNARVFNEDGALFEAVGDNGYIEIEPDEVEEWDSVEVPDVAAIEAEEAAKPWWKKWFG